MLGVGGVVAEAEHAADTLAEGLADRIAGAAVVMGNDGKGLACVAGALCKDCGQSSGLDKNTMNLPFGDARAGQLPGRCAGRSANGGGGRERSSNGCSTMGYDE